MSGFARFILVLAVLASPRLATAQPDNLGGLGPRLTLNSENYNFGKIMAGDTVKYTIFATNTGDAPLEISNAHGNCSCTVVGSGANHIWAALHLEPGQGCGIPVEISTVAYAGQNISKTVAITSNDKRHPMVNVQIHGMVWQPIEVTPSLAMFNITEGIGSNSVQVIKILNHADQPLTLSDPVCSTNAFSISLATNVPGQEFQLTVMVPPPPRLPPASSNDPAATTPSNAASFRAAMPSSKVRSLSGTVTIKTSSPLMNPLRVGAYETIYPEVRVYPESVPVPVMRLSRALTNHITISDDSTNITLSHPMASVPGIETSVSVIRSNRQFSLNAVISQGFDFPTNQPVFLTVQTDNARYPVLSVPLTPMYGAAPRAPVKAPPPQRSNALPASIRAIPPARGGNL